MSSSPTWFFWASLSAVFAALTAIFAKVGIQGVENIAAVANLFVAANRDARMRDAYDTYLQSWKDAGGELFVHFNLSFGYGKFGSWGVLEALGQTPRPPKAEAIDDFNAANACWWADCTP